MKLHKLVVEKFRVVANFHDVIKSFCDRKPSAFRYFTHFTSSQLVQDFTLG